jgi:hypothetical protein
VKIVEQPAVQPLGPERFLDGGHVERHQIISIAAWYLDAPWSPKVCL